MAELTHIKGFSQLDQFLREFPEKMERNILRGALRAGAKVVLPVAQGNIHPVSGALSKSLKLRTGSQNGRVTAKVYTRVFYSRFVEYGTKPHVIKAKDGGALFFGGGFVESVQHPGSKAANGGFGFMRNALDTQATAAVLAVGEYIKKRLSTKYGIDTADVELGVDQ